VVFSVKWRERLALGKSLAIHSDERVATLWSSIWPQQVWWNDSSPVTFVIERTNEGDGSGEHGRRVSGQGARMRRARCSDARLLRQGTIARNSEEVADHGRFRRKARPLGRLTWRPRYSAPFRLASPTLAIAANSPRTRPSPSPEACTSGVPAVSGGPKSRPSGSAR